MRRIIPAILVVSMTLATFAQSGGQYDLSHNVIASGGSNSTGASYAVNGTVGQPVESVQSSGSTFNVRGGFWAFQSFAPTAAGASISGRVQTWDEQGIANARLTLTNAMTSETRIVQSSSFGYFRFDDIPVGEFYQLQVSAKQYVFKIDIQFFNLLDELTDVSFVAMPRQ